MADTKISQLNAGNPAQSGDLLPIARNVSGTETNFNVTAASIASLYAGQGTIDASTQAGSDICAKINNAWGALTAISALGGTVTVFNNPGVISCSSNPFASYPGGFNGRLLIAPYTQIQTSASWVLPSWVYIDGMSTHPVTQPPGGITGSAIQVSNSFPTATPLIQVGSASVIGGVVVTNIRLSCVTPAGPAISGCTAYQNHWSQEDTRLENVVLDGCDAFCMDISTSQSQDAGTIRNVTMGMNGVNNVNSQCFRIGSSASTLTGALFLQNISCGGGSNSVEPNILGTIDGSAVTIIGMHMEQGIVGLVTGSQLVTHGVTVMGSDCTGTAAYPVTTCYQISSAHGQDGINFIGNFAPSFGNVTNILVDQLPNGGTIPSATESSIGIYSRGSNNAILSTSNVITSTLHALSLNTYTVATLPSAATEGNGAMVIVTDALTAGITTCVGGGTTTMIGVSNGSVWSCH